MWNHIDAFLNSIASTLDYERDSLFLVAELRSGGPTVQPGPSQQVDKLVEIRNENDAREAPYGGYDSLGSKHIEYRVVREKAGSKVNVKQTLFSFQLHPFPGNCGICVNRWVRSQDTKDWPASLLKEAVKFRGSIARRFGYRLMLISTGSSFHGAEQPGEFQAIYEGMARSPVTIGLLDLKGM